MKLPRAEDLDLPGTLFGYIEPLTRLCQTSEITERAPWIAERAQRLHAPFMCVK
jgi:hypothetical protein